jgi:phosphopantothenoylcysteine decarboxylase
MAKVLLGVTGSVAAIYTPELFNDLKSAGNDVKVVATAASLYFFDPAQLQPLAPGRRNAEVVVLDADEWPGEHYRRGDPVLHIELRRWAEVLLIAPLDANTLAKLALGLTDNCLTCVWRAWDRTRPIVLAPAMNTLMWEHPATARHLRQLACDMGVPPPPALPLPDLVEWINRQPAPLRIVPPAIKRLACDDVGVGAMAPRDAILAAVGGLAIP